MSINEPSVGGQAGSTEPAPAPAAAAPGPGVEVVRTRDGRELSLTEAQRLMEAGEHFTRNQQHLAEARRDFLGEVAAEEEALPAPMMETSYAGDEAGAPPSFRIETVEDLERVLAEQQREIVAQRRTIQELEAAQGTLEITEEVEQVIRGHSAEVSAETLKRLMVEHGTPSAEAGYLIWRGQQAEQAERLARSAPAAPQSPAALPPASAPQPPAHTLQEALARVKQRFPG